MKRPAANWKTFAVDILGHISSSQKTEKVHCVKGRVVCGKLGIAFRCLRPRVYA